MFRSFKDSFQLIKSAIKAFLKYPSLIIPLFSCWVLLLPIVISIEFFIPWEKFSDWGIVFIAFLIILFFSFVISSSCILLLEQIKQIETHGRLSLSSCLSSAKCNIKKSLPIIFLWGLVWFLIILIELLVRGEDREEQELEFDVKNVTKTMAGYEDKSLSVSAFDAIKKGVRMLAFLIYPAVCWEEKKPKQAIKKGFAVAKTHPKQFFAGFLLTEITSTFIFLPIFIVFLVDQKTGDVQDWVWFMTLVYTGFAWSFSLLIEQLYTAELYLWHMHWEKVHQEAKKNGLNEPKLSDVKRPSIMDDIPDLLNVI